MPVRKPPMHSQWPASRPITAPVAVPEPPTVAFFEDGCVVAHWRGVMIGVWATRTTIESAIQMEKVLESLSATHPKFSSVQLITRNFAFPSADVRARLSALTLRSADRLACSGTLLGGVGFWASALRGVVTSIQVLDLQRSRQRVFSDLTALVDWVTLTHNAATGDSIDPVELRRVLESLLGHPSVHQYAST